MLDFGSAERLLERRFHGIDPALARLVGVNRLGNDGKQVTGSVITSMKKGRKIVTPSHSCRD
jgi:hypothetical protein